MTIKKDIHQFSRDDLLSLPIRAWNEISEYDTILLLSTQKIHESGWAMIAIIGVREYQPIEIACNCCDDIEWRFNPESNTKLRMDCVLKSSALHAWSYKNKFRVGRALSSITIEVI